MRTNVGTLSPSLGNQIKRLTSSDMSLDMQWRTATFRAKFFGPYEQRNSPSGFWDKCSFIAPIGIEHFFDPFCLNPQRPWRATACQTLGIPSCQVAEDTHLEKLDQNKFTLTPRQIPVERKTTADKHTGDVNMVAGLESESEAESRWSGVSDNSSTDSECTLLEASCL